MNDFEKSGDRWCSIDAIYAYINRCSKDLYKTLTSIRDVQSDCVFTLSTASEVSDEDISPMNLSNRSLRSSSASLPVLSIDFSLLTIALFFFNDPSRLPVGSGGDWLDAYSSFTAPFPVLNDDRLFMMSLDDLTLTYTNDYNIIASNIYCCCIFVTVYSLFLTIMTGTSE